jgi:hypothetical protein
MLDFLPICILNYTCIYVMINQSETMLQTCSITKLYNIYMYGQSNSLAVNKWHLKADHFGLQ